MDLRYILKVEPAEFAGEFECTRDGEKESSINS